MESFFLVSKWEPLLMVNVACWPHEYQIVYWSHYLSIVSCKLHCAYLCARICLIAVLIRFQWHWESQRCNRMSNFNSDPIAIGIAIVIVLSGGTISIDTQLISRNSVQYAGNQKTPAVTFLTLKRPWRGKEFKSKTKRII